MRVSPRRAAAVAAAAAIGVFGMGATLAAAAPTGASRPAAPRVATVAATKTTTYHFNGSYHGTITIVWNSSGFSTATIHGKGKGAIFGLTSVSGSGTVKASAQSDPINGSGTLSGSKVALKLKLATNSTATAVGTAAPTTVTVSGTAKVLKGAGKFAGATGSLRVSGAFSIQGTSGKETDSFNATLKGTVKVTS